MLGVRTAQGAADTVGRPLFYHSSNLIASLKVPLLRFPPLMAAMCMRVGHGHEGGGWGPNFDFRAGPNGLPTFCEKSKGMALCSRFVMIRLEGGENE